MPGVLSDARCSHGWRHRSTSPFFFPKEGFAYLAPRLASRTCETGGTHGAGGASVARGAGCSLLSGFALNEGKKSA